MNHLTIPQKEKANGMKWVVYLVVSRNWDELIGSAEVEIKIGVN